MVLSGPEGDDEFHREEENVEDDEIEEEHSLSTREIWMEDQHHYKKHDAKLSERMFTHVPILIEKIVPYRDHLNSTDIR
ncbi:atp-dependent rna helicase [Musa troglodytarum]|uniref:Atp-dependent rna helicase n=1 Tax=Musa troglodytarum TaxID=320322 RepID=A0A9E7G4A6_9LILI|nr:atp-dependent rna helicase [Musa troglodytarum]